MTSGEREHRRCCSLRTMMCWLRCRSARAASLYRVLSILVWGTLAALIAGCSKSGSEGLRTGPQEVLFTEAIQQNVSVVRHWMGSLDGSVNAAFRRGVSGY